MEKRGAIEVHDLTVAYDVKPVLWDVDLMIPTGRLAAVVGPNGAGKSTLLKAMLGLVTPISGAVNYPGYEDVSDRIRKQHIGYVPQNESVDWDFPATVLEIVVMGRYGHLGWFKRPGKSDFEKARKVLQQVGMEEFCGRQISQLSGGQQQRVFLARALVQEADIYFMDEPFKGVDAQTEKSIVALLKELKDQGKTVIVVHHDLQTVATYFDWVTLINKKVIANGAVEEVFHAQNVEKAYRSSNLLLKEVV